MMLLPCSSIMFRNSSVQRLLDDVDERANGLDGDTDLVARLQCERVGRDDAGSGQKEAPLRKRVVAEEELDERVGLALELRERGLARENGFAGARDLQPDFGR